MRRAVLLSAVFCSLAALEARAAEIPPVLRSGSHPMWASLSMGGAINLEGGGSGFKLIETFGIHFTPNFGGPAAGPALALDIQETFGFGSVAIEVGPKFCWDIPIVQGLGLYLSPSLMLGFAHWGGWNGATIQIGFEGKLILGDRGLVFFRPISFDILAGGNTTANYDLIFGGGVIF
jgi:hypothetical protein